MNSVIEDTIQLIRGGTAQMFDHMMLYILCLKSLSDLTYVVENKHIFSPTKSNIDKKRVSRSSSVIVCFCFTLIRSFSE